MTVECIMVYVNQTMPGGNPDHQHGAGRPSLIWLMRKQALAGVELKATALKRRWSQQLGQSDNLTKALYHVWYTTNFQTIRFMNMHHSFSIILKT